MAVDRNNSTRAMLLQALDCAFDRRGWHGANLTSAIRGVRFGNLARRVHGRRSVWEQVLHAAYWKHRVLALLTGRRAFPRKGSDWPRLPDPLTEAAWRDDLALLHALHRELRDAVATLPPVKLNEKCTWLVQGAAAHDVYHAGQIKLLRHLL